MRFFSIPALCIALAASPAMACLPEYYPEAPAPARQPGQSDGEYAGILKAHQAKLAEAERLRFEAKRLGMMKQEGDRWEASESVVLAEVVAVAEMPLLDDRGEEIGISPKVTLKPVSWLKGKGKKRNFTVHFTGSTSCGYNGGGDAVYGKVGDRYVVFVTKSAPSMKSISDTISRDRALDPRTRDALEM